MTRQGKIVRSDPDSHAMTFGAARASDPAAFAESCHRGTDNGLDLAQAASQGLADSEPDPILDLNFDQFVKWLESRNL